MLGDFIASLALRAHLKRAKAAGNPVCLHYRNGMTDVATIVDVGWFFVRVDVLADDEQTWLSRDVVMLQDLCGLNEKSTRRVRAQLMAKEEILSGPNATPVPAYHFDEDDEDWDDED